MKKKTIAILILSILGLIALVEIGQALFRPFMFKQHVFIAPHHGHHRGHGMNHFEPNAFYLGNSLFNAFE